MMNVPTVTWTVEWPAQGTLEMFISGFKMWVSVRIFGADVHLSFDRCRDYSTKSKARFAQENTTTTRTVDEWPSTHSYISYIWRKGSGLLTYGQAL